MNLEEILAVLEKKLKGGGEEPAPAPINEAQPWMTGYQGAPGVAMPSGMAPEAAQQGVGSLTPEEEALILAQRLQKRNQALAPWSKLANPTE